MTVYEFKYFIGIDPDGEDVYQSFWIEARGSKDAWRRAVKEKKRLKIHSEIHLNGREL